MNSGAAARLAFPDGSKPHADLFAGTRVLVVDDDGKTRDSIAELLRGWDLTIETARDGREAMERIPSFMPHVMITDLVMPGMDGFELLTALAGEGRDFPVIVLTAMGTVETALRTVHDLGAFWFLEKPVRSDALRLLMERAARQSRLAEDTQRLQRQLAYQGVLGDLVGRSAPMQRAFSLLHQVGPTGARVLLTGESGTGKELAARAIHQLSTRARGPFIAVNCAALPESLMESELFGHEKGAFTGAAARRAGCFELAHNGTLLLDELAEMPVRLQAKLLRVLEDSRVRRLGSPNEMPVDVRVVASTNRVLDEALRAGDLREDLYYRLSVFTIHLPPLRERTGDLGVLAEALIANFNQRYGCQVAGVDDEVMHLFERYTWPGNVRELRNVVERAVIVAHKGTLSVRHLPPGFGDLGGRTQTSSESGPGIRLPFGTTMEAAEMALIRLTLSQTGNDRTRAAEILGISRKTIFNRLREQRETEKNQPDAPA